ncbi:Rhodanese-like domain-containing protein [Pisolithus marmoratus]|nr:Rhodanese-like domain-containing protein [Pisolithus marmoratus]
MLRKALGSTLRISLRPAHGSPRAFRPSFQGFARHQSSKPADPEVLRAARKLHDVLQGDWKSPILSYEQVKPKTLQPSNDAYLIDVREPDEVIRGSIPSSVNLPLSTLANSLNLKPRDFREKHGFDKPETTQEIIFYCRSGKRSASACDIARRHGYQNLFNYEGSWLDWVAKEGGQKP